MSWVRSLLARVAPAINVPLPGNEYPSERLPERHRQNALIADAWQRRLEARAQAIEADVYSDLHSESTMLAGQMADEQQRDILMRALDERRRRRT